MIIYKITNKINGKIYIGLTTQNIKDRWEQHIRSALNKTHPDYNTVFKKAIRKYGSDNFTIEIIDEADNLIALKKLEQYWIKYYNTYIGWENCNGYNSTIGGDSPTHSGRKVCKINILTGEIEEIYNTIAEAERKYSRGIFEIAHHQLNGQKPKGYTWRFEEELDNFNHSDLLIQYKAICQLDLNGNYLNTWIDREAAAEEASTSVANIWACINNQRKSAGCFQWCKYEDLNKRLGVPLREKKNTKQIGQYDLYDNLIQLFPSMTEASKATGVNITKISAVCNGKRKTSGGYKWKIIT